MEEMTLIDEELVPPEMRRFLVVYNENITRAKSSIDFLTKENEKLADEIKELRSRLNG